MNRSKIFLLLFATVLLAAVIYLLPRPKPSFRSQTVFPRPTLPAIARVSPSSLLLPTLEPKKETPSELTKIAQGWDQPIVEPDAARFVAWANQYRAATPEEKRALEQEGIALAGERRKFLAELIQTNPERALELAAPMAVRRDLPDAVRNLLEERISGRGDLSVLGVLAEPGKELTVPPTFRIADIGGKEFKAFAYGRRLGEPTLRHIPLNGIAVGNLLAVNENPVRLLEPMEAAEIKRPAEAICSVSGDSTKARGDETPVDVGGEIIFLCQRVHAVELNRQIVAADGGDGTSEDGGDPQASTYTEGQKKLILIRVDFPDLQGTPVFDTTSTNLINGLNGFYTECSYGRAGFVLAGAGSEITPTFRMPQNASYYGTNNYYSQLRTDARAAATAAGYVLGNYNFDLICMGSVPGFSWSGLGYVGSAGAWIRNSFGTGTSAHELGHNFGLNHANFWDTYGASVIGTNGTNVEYGDIFDTMGSASAGNNHFNARYKRYLNWLTTNEVVTVTTSGTYRIYCHDNTNSSGVRALNTAKDSQTNYWIEFRQKFTSNKWLTSGASLRWAQSGNQKSLLLDTTPGSTDGKNDSAIVIGRTFADKTAGVYITPIGKGGTSPESLDVVINKGTFPGNVAPTISISASATNVSTGVTINFSAAASDSNGDALAYYWDFGDGNFGTNGVTAAKSWSSTAEYVVRCTVTDMKGGVASDSVIVRVGSPSTYRISGRILTNSAPIEGVRVYVSTTRMTYTDSDGTYSIVGLPAGSYTVNAQLDGYTLMHPSFNNPVGVGPNAVNIDFNTSSSLPPTITSQPQGNAVAVGTSVTFSVGASGGPPLTYQWRFNGANLLNATNSSFTLASAQLSQAGNYSVMVSTPAGQTNSINAALTVNVAPVLASIGDRLVNAGETLTWTNTATDQNFPPDILSFSLAGSSLPGATVGSGSGIFIWAAPETEMALTNFVTISVADNGAPVLSDSESFAIVVVPPPRLAESAQLPEGILTLTWTAFPGKNYQAQYKNNLDDAGWTNLGGPMLATEATLSLTDNLTAQPQRFYRLWQLD